MSYREMLMSLFSVVIGALITIIPNFINKKIDSKNKLLEENRSIKLANYVELINLITIVLKNQSSEIYFEPLISKINIVNMIGSAEVVIALNEYIRTWGNEEAKDEQNKCYFQLLIEMRKDIGIDRGDLSNHQTIGLLDINKVD